MCYRSAAPNVTHSSRRCQAMSTPALMQYSLQLVCGTEKTTISRMADPGTLTPALPSSRTTILQPSAADHEAACGLMHAIRTQRHVGRRDGASQDSESGVLEARILCCHSPATDAIEGC